MRAALWFLLPSDGEFRHSSTSLQYYLACQGQRVILQGDDVMRPPLESYLNWIEDPAPVPPRKAKQENLPPSIQPHKLPRKMRPQRQQKHHQHYHLGTTGSVPGSSQPPRCARSTPVKHLQPLARPQHQQPPGPTANHNSERPDLLDEAELGRLYKPVGPSISKDTTTRSHRDNFSGLTLSFTTCSQRSHQDYFSGSPCWALDKSCHLTDPCREGSTIAVRGRSDPIQSPPRAASPDVYLDVGVELSEAAATERIPRADHPPVVLDIPSSAPEQSEPRRCPETPGKWFRPPSRDHKRPRTSSPPSPRRPRKRPSPAGRWCE